MLPQQPIFIKAPGGIFGGGFVFVVVFEIGSPYIAI
jgi:hypothetical protein